MREGTFSGERNSDCALCACHMLGLRHITSHFTTTNNLEGCKLFPFGLNIKRPDSESGFLGGWSSLGLIKIQSALKRGCAATGSVSVCDCDIEIAAILF